MQPRLSVRMAQALADQVAANRSALPHHASFADHRERLTRLVCAAHGPSPSHRSLCVLGAGNCYDLDFAALVQAFSSIHLVDLDAEALARALERQPEAVRSQLVVHAPLDLSGMLDRLDRWSRMELDPAELMGHAARTTQQLCAQLGQFDAVLSPCMLSQMQLSLLQALGDDHRLFEAARVTLTLTHLRNLAGLLKPGGRATFVTDVSADVILPPGTLDALSASGADARDWVWALARAGHVFQFADPSSVLELARQDPALRECVHVSELKAAWVWQNGSAGRLLVYALEISRNE